MEELAVAALDWLLAVARPTGAGLEWTFTEDDDDVDPTLYNGGAGIVLALLEAQHHFGDDRYGDAALRGARTLAATECESSALYFGETGIAFALHAIGDRLGDAGSATAARAALDRVRSRFDGERWNDMTELFVGNAGIALGALATGDVGLAELAVEPYLRLADPTPGGVNWAVRPAPARSHHMAHGTVGIVVALASVARATGRADLMELALAGAADVVSRDEAGPDGFLVPNSDPPHRPDVIERYSYGWCSGPAGDAQMFRLLGAVTGDPTWAVLGDRCWHTVTTSGLPKRLRPGFWDNSGRCCGTAGVLALASDRADGRAFADVLVTDLAARATLDAAGARWSNQDLQGIALAARRSWAMGSAGILRELLRHIRITQGRDPAYAVPMPDHHP